MTLLPVLGVALVLELVVTLLVILGVALVLVLVVKLLVVPSVALVLLHSRGSDHGGMITNQT